MSGRYRLAALALLAGSGAALAIALYVNRTGTPLGSSLAPAFQILGVPVKAADALLGRVIPVDALDEKDLGQAFHARYEAQSDAGDRDFIYVNELLRVAAAASEKPFTYRAYIIPEESPNAAALPGGAILVTRGLLNVLGSEAEVLAVLSHEVGHIEVGHCFDAVKFELLTRKIGADSLGGLADFATRLLVSHAFSKTQEDEADEYAWSRLVRSDYDPAGVGGSFTSLLAFSMKEPGGAPASRSRADLLRDYFSSHPPLEIRAAEFVERDAAWWAHNSSERRYTGRRNLTDRRSLSGGLEVPEEWVGGAPAP